MKPVEARDHASEELQDRLRDLKEELFNLRFQAATGQLDNHRRIRLVRREIGMIRTVLRERELYEEETEEPQAAGAASDTEELEEG